MDLFCFSNWNRLFSMLILIISSLIPLSVQALDFKKYLSPVITEKSEAERRQGTADGAFWLGVHYLELGQQQDLQKAFRYFKAASSMGHTHSGAIVGFFFLDDSFGSADLMLAKKWILSSYKQGSEIGAYGVALLRSAGAEVKQAPSNLEVLQIAWDAGLVESGFAYAAELQKKNTKQSHILAYDIYKSLCAQGDIDACTNTGVMALTSLYVPMSKPHGYGYLLYASDRGSAVAKEMLSDYAAYLTPSDRSQAVDFAVALMKKGPK